MPDLSKPFTLRMAGYELIGEDATEKIATEQGAEWLAFTLISWVEANNVRTETADLLRRWHDRREGNKVGDTDDDQERSPQIVEK